MRGALALVVFVLIAGRAALAGEAHVHEGTIENIADPRGVRFDRDGTLLIAAGRAGVLRANLAAPASALTLAAAKPATLLSSGPLAFFGDGSALVSLDKDAAPPPGIPADADAVATSNDAVAWCLRDRDGVFRTPRSGGEARAVVIPDDARHGWLAPEALAFAPDGSLWVADTGHSRVVRIAPDGTAASFGERGFFPGQFIEPCGIAFDAGGPLVIDRLGHRVTRLDWKGALRDVFGLHALRPREGRGKIHYPNAIAVDPATGRVAVCEAFERRVQVFRPLRDGESAPVRPPPPSRDGVSSHFGIDVSACANLVAAWEPESGTVVLWDTRLDPPIYVTTLGGNGDKPGRFIRPVAVLVADDGTSVWVLDALGEKLERWSLRRDLSRSVEFDAFMAVLAESIDLPQVRRECGAAPDRAVDLVPRPAGGAAGRGVGVVFANGDVAWVDSVAPATMDARPRADPQGRVLAAALDRAANEILLLRADAIERRGESGARVVALPPSLASPRGVAAGRDGRMLVSDAASDALLELDAQGAVVRAFGAPPRSGSELFDGAAAARDGSLWLPAGVDVGDGSSVYVVDYGNHRLQRFGWDGAWQASFTLSKSRAAAPSPPTAKPDAAEEARAAALRREALDRLKAGRGEISLPAGGVLRWRAAQPIERAEPFALEVDALDAQGRPLEGVELRCDAEMPQHRHGMNVVPRAMAIAPGRWRVEPLLLHMPGRWELLFDLKRDGRVRRGQTTLELE
jgi:sugar lactone lactonase YvrE